MGPDPHGRLTGALQARLWNNDVATSQPQGVKNGSHGGLILTQETDPQCLAYMEQVGQRRTLQGAAIFIPLATNYFAACD